MPHHNTLTGADLHEPKGVESASAKTVYVANGSGSGAWTKQAAVDVTVSDPQSVFTGNNVEDALYELYQGVFLIEGSIPDVSNIDKLLLPIPFSCEVLSLKMILADAISVADTVITVTRSDGAAMGTQTIVASGSAEGNSYTFTPTGNETFTGAVHHYIKCVCNARS